MPDWDLGDHPDATARGLCDADEAPAPPPAETLPNIVIIFTDDQGYGDVGVYGADGFETPHLDRMASEGIRFTSFYVSTSTCSA